MTEEKKNHTQLMFGLTKPTKRSDPKTISGKEQYRALIEKNRAFGALFIASNQREVSAPPLPDEQGKE